jgi:hypothetical protein
MFPPTSGAPFFKLVRVSVDYKGAFAWLHMCECSTEIVDLASSHSDPFSDFPPAQ